MIIREPCSKQYLKLQNFMEPSLPRARLCTCLLPFPRFLDSDASQQICLHGCKSHTSLKEHFMKRLVLGDSSHCIPGAGAMLAPQRNMLADGCCWDLVQAVSIWETVCILRATEALHRVELQQALGEEVTGFLC